MGFMSLQLEFPPQAQLFSLSVRWPQRPTAPACLALVLIQFYNPHLNLMKLHYSADVTRSNHEKALLITGGSNRHFDELCSKKPLTTSQVLPAVSHCTLGGIATVTCFYSHSTFSSMGQRQRAGAQSPGFGCRRALRLQEDAARAATAERHLMAVVVCYFIREQQSARRSPSRM